MTRRIATIAVLVAASVVAMMAIHIPIVPTAPFLKYDPSDAVALLAGFFWGPGTGVLAVLLKDVLYQLVTGGNPLGPLADFIAAGTFVGASAWLYLRLARRPVGQATGPVLAPMAVAILVGTLARVAVMTLANFPILYLEFGMPPQRVVPLLGPAIIPFNALKGLLNGAFAAVLAAALVRRAAVAHLSR